jgi:hypothetical protein
LDAEGDTDDGNHHAYAGYDIFHGSKDSAQQKPKDIH